MRVSIPSDLLQAEDQDGKSPFLTLRNDVSKELRAQGWKDLADPLDDMFPPADKERRDRALDELRTTALLARTRLGRLPPAPPPAPGIGRPRPTLSNLSGPSPVVPTEEVRRNPNTGLPEMPADNAAYLGRSLFTDYLLPVELGGTLLLAATVGAIAIAQRRNGTARPSRPPQSAGLVDRLVGGGDGEPEKKA